MNYDLKSLYKWLLSNKISLNTAKTELIFFRKPHNLIPNDIKIKLHGTRLFPVNKIKYLGFYLDEHLDGSAHIMDLKYKLRRSIGMLAKTKPYLPKNYLIQMYYATFSSHMLYGCQIWSLQNKNIREIETLQNSAIRILSDAFNSGSDYLKIHVTPHYHDLQILKLRDQLTLKNCFFVHDYFNNKLPKSFDNYFTLKKDLYHNATRNATKGHIYIPGTETMSYGTNSLKHNCLTSWNAFIDSAAEVNHLQLSKAIIKKIIKNLSISGYTSYEQIIA